LTNLELIDHLLEQSKTLARDLQSLPGVSVHLLLLNSAGFDPTATITLKGPAYHDRQIEFEIDLFALENELHLDVYAIDFQNGDFLLDIHNDLTNLDELRGYLDKALSLYHNLMSSESENV
jgi:hypothetical protein